MELVYIYIFGVISGFVLTYFCLKSGAKLYLDASNVYLNNETELKEEKPKKKETESWDWEQYDDYVNREDDPVA